MLTKGLHFSIFDGASFLLIDGITTFSPGAKSWTTQETTPIHTTSRARTYTTVLNEVGDFTFTMLVVDGDPGQAEVIAANGTGVEKQFRYTLPNNTLGSFTVGALVTGCKPVTDKESVTGYDVSLKINGVIADEAATLLSVAVTDEHEGVYETGDTIQLTATYDEYVTVTGSPRIAIALDSGTVYAAYEAGSNSNVLTFEYEFEGGDEAGATDFEITSPISLNSGTIRDVAGNNATLIFTPPDTAEFLVND